MQNFHQLKKYIPIILIFLSAGLGLLRFNSLQIGTSYDDAHYIILAESLSSGQGYELINFPKPQIERAFPPGWPILLSPLTHFFPGNYTILKLFSLALWLASVPLIHKLLSSRVDSPGLEIITGLIAINPLLVGTSVTVMSESAYLFFSILAIYLFDKWYHAEKRNYWLLILIAFIAYYSQLIRTIGISLSISLILYLLFSKRFRDAGIVTGIFFAGMLAQGLVDLNNGGSFISTGYQSQVFSGSAAEKLAQMWSNVLGYFDEVLAGSLIPIFGSSFTSFLSGYGLGFLPGLLNLIIILLVIIGFAQSMTKARLMDFYFVIFTFGILAFWNPDVGSVKARFLIPIIPFLYPYLWQGVAWVLTKASRNRSNVKLRIEPIAVIIIAIVLLARNLQDWRNPVMNQITDLSIGASWVAENAPDDAIVMVNEPVPSYVHVKRKTINYPKAGQDLEKYVENQGIDYIIVAPKLQSPRSDELDKNIANEILPVLNTQPEKYLMVYSQPENNVTVYEVVRNENQ